PPGRAGGCVPGGGHGGDRRSANDNRRSANFQVGGTSLKAQTASSARGGEPSRPYSRLKALVKAPNGSATTISRLGRGAAPAPRTHGEGAEKSLCHKVFFR